MKPWQEKITFALLGTVLTLGGVGIYNHITKPDLVVIRQHNGDPQGNGENRLLVKGIDPRAFYADFSRGYEGRKTSDEMIQSALEDIKAFQLYSGAEIDPSKGVSEIRIEIKK